MYIINCKMPDCKSQDIDCWRLYAIHEPWHQTHVSLHCTSKRQLLGKSKIYSILYECSISIRLITLFLLWDPASGVWYFMMDVLRYNVPYHNCLQAVLDDAIICLFILCLILKLSTFYPEAWSAISTFFAIIKFIWF